MAKFAQEFTNFEFVQTVSAQITWSHNTFLLDKIKDQPKRNWYINKVIENSWSLSILKHQVELNLYERQAIKSTTNNFETALLNPQKDLSIEILKDPKDADMLLKIKQGKHNWEDVENDLSLLIEEIESIQDKNKAKDINFFIENKKHFIEKIYSL